jgi:hypothetical protein
VGAENPSVRVKPFVRTVEQSAEAGPSVDVAAQTPSGLWLIAAAEAAMHRVDT